MFEYSIWIVTHLGGLALMLLVAGGLGKVCLRKQDFHSALEKGLFAIALGLSLCALVLFVLGLMRGLYPGVIWALTLFGGLALLISLIPWARTLRFEQMRKWRVLPWWQVVLLVIGVVLGLVYWVKLLTLSQYPPIDWDAVMYHLPLARAHLTAHRLTIDTGLAAPVVPMLNHLLFVWAMALMDDVLAQMVEHTFMMLTALGLLAWGWRQNQVYLGGAAAACWLAHPIVLWLSGSAYVDLGVTCFIFFGLYALRLFWEEHEIRWWYLSMALLGAAIGIKMTALGILALAVGMGLWICFKSGLEIKKLVWGGVLAFLIAAPSYAFIAYHTGNPVWPLLPPLSQGEWGGERIVRWNHMMRNIGMARTLQNYLLLPVKIFMHPESVVAERPIFPLVLLWPLALIVSWWNRSVRWWAAWTLAFTTIWFLGSRQLRYLTPAWPLAGLALFESLQWLLDRIWRAAVFQRLVWISLIVWGAYSAVQYTDADYDVRRMPPTTPAAREKFKDVYVQNYRGVRYINERAKASDKVYISNASWLPYQFRIPVIDYHGPLQPALWPEYKWPGDKEWLRYLETQQVNWILVNHGGDPTLVSSTQERPLGYPCWPHYSLVYSDNLTWVFRRLPAPDASLHPAAYSSQNPCDAAFTEQVSTSLSAYEGYHDITNCGGIMGWVWDAKQPEKFIRVEIYDGDRLLATVIANQFREDLVRSGKGNGQYGFVYPVPPQLKDGQPHEIRLRIAGTNFNLIHTPKTINCPVP